MVGIVAGMERELRLHGEDEPSTSRIDVRKTQLLLDEGAGLFSHGCEEYAVHALDHSSANLCA